MAKSNPVKITVFRWAGSWGPFKVNIPCGECSLTQDIIQDTLDTDLNGIEAKLDVRDWLSEWWKPLFKGGIHAPIIIVDGKVVSQGQALNRGILTEAVIQAYAKKSTIENNKNIVFGKASCPHCVRAKTMLDEKGIDYEYFDVIKSPRAVYEMISRVKLIIGEKTPVTVPQVWMQGEYIGGADALEEKLG